MNRSEQKTKKITRKIKPSSRAARAVRSPKKESSATPWLELFQREDDSASHAVREHLSELSLDYVAHNVSGKDLKHAQLVRAGGRDSIPFLIDHRTGAKLYDADAILTYLEREYGERERSRLLRGVHRLEVLANSRADRLVWSVLTPLARAEETVNDIWETVLGTARVLRASFEKAATARREDTAPTE